MRHNEQGSMSYVLCVSWQIVNERGDYALGKRYPKVLVPGGAGFIGSRLFGALINRASLCGWAEWLKGGKFKSLDGHVFW